MASSGSSYWCYRCNRVIRVRSGNQDVVICPDCSTGFIEHLDARSRSTLRWYSPAEMYFDSSQNLETITSSRLRRVRNGGDRTTFNPVIVLRGPQTSDSGIGNEETDAERGNFEFYYDDGTGTCLRPLPASMSEFLMGSGFDRVLDQLSNIDLNGVSRFVNPPAPKKAIESMPKVKILPCHLAKDSHCAVCKEPFELDTEAREMPCKHIYHWQCIFPWLSMRNSCPLCRCELPTEENGGMGDSDETVGLTIWRLPGGGFAVGRFNRGRRAADREFPVVFTEMDGGFNTAAGAPRRISWVPGIRRARESRGLARAFRGFTSLLGRIRISTSRSNPEFERRSPFMDVIYGRSGAAANYFNQFNLGENRFTI